MLGWYKDSLGKWTGGYGHLRKPGEEFLEVTQGRADLWLEQDIKSARQAMNSLLDRLPFVTQHLMDVLVSVAFQMGILWHKKFPKTFKLMTEGKFNEAAEEVANSIWYTQTPTRVKDFQVALRETQWLFDQYKQSASDVY